MKNGGILGYDLNEKTCQISYYDTAKDEPLSLIHISEPTRPY